MVPTPNPSPSLDRSPTGVPGLDEVLEGGYLPGRLYLIEGQPGAGKTTLALQYLMAGAAIGERCLYVTLSESEEELRTNAKSHGWSLEGIEIFELIAEASASGDEVGLTMYHPGEIELSETTRKVIDAVERTKPQRLVFDSLSELRLLAQNSLRYRRQILALKQFFSGRGCTVLLLDDRTSEGEDLQLRSIAHGVVALEHGSPTYGPSLRQLEVLKFRGSGFRSGRQDVAIVREGVRVYPRLKASDHHTEFVRDSVPSGVSRLDTMLGGGIDRGTSTLLIGPAGSGKSTVALQYATAAAKRGDHAVVFTFEEARHLLCERANSLGIPFTQGRGPGEIEVRQIAPGELTPGHFADLVCKAVEIDHARVVVIDSLNGYINAMPEERALSVQLHELLSYLGNRGVTTFLVAVQSGLFGQARAPVDTSYLADTVLGFRMFEHGGKVKKAVSVMKKRSGFHEESIRQIWMDPQGIHLSEPLLKLRGVLTGVPVEVRPSHEEGPAADD